MNKITRTYECNRNMTCPYCGQEIHVGDSVGLVDESVVLNTKYRLILFGVKQTDTVMNYSVYGCCKCCKKRNLFNIVVAWLFGAITVIWFLYSILNNIPMVVTIFVLLAIWAIIGLPTLIIKWLLKIKKASYQHAQECHALV